MDAVQEDAVHTALRAFGLSPGDQAISLELARGQNTALARVNIIEDSVVEHDARAFPDYELTDSDITGRAVFEKGHERLEVFTANRRPLEEGLRRRSHLSQHNASEHGHGPVQDAGTSWPQGPGQ